MRNGIVFGLAVTLTAGMAWTADFTYTDRTEMTGGSLKRLMGIASKFGGNSGPQTTVHRFSGSKMSTESGDTRTVFDLAAENITAVDLKKKEFSVITFAEMAEAMQAAMARLSAARTKAKSESKDGQEVQMNWKVSVDRTGKTADIAGVKSEQAIMTLAMEASQAGQQQGPMAVSSMKIETWHGKPPGWEEAQKTMRALAEKMVMNNTGIAAFAQTSAGAMDGLREASKEMAKLEGIPMRSITRMGGGSMGGGANGSAAAETPSAQKNEDPKDAREAAAGAVLGRLGGFGRFGKKKPKDEPKQEDRAAAAPAPAGGSSDGVLMEVTGEVISYNSNAVDPELMKAPDGFKQVEHPMKKMLEKNKK
ncbi:MAG: hypothetical protein R2762_02980 [Bryobacteraceae bacterium]